VQYAPGTQVNCSGLLGLVGCLVNDVVKLGGAILGQLPLINGVVASARRQWDPELVEPAERRIHQPGSAHASVAQQRRACGECRFAWLSNYTGAGIGVALIDSGVSNHVDLYQGILPFSRVAYQQSLCAGKLKLR